MKQKIIRVGNSAAITIPTNILKEKGLTIGEEAEVEIYAVKKTPALSKEFGNWVDQYIADNKVALEKLANLK